jgi:hypothetical protein
VRQTNLQLQQARPQGNPEPHRLDKNWEEEPNKGTENPKQEDVQDKHPDLVDKPREGEDSKRLNLPKKKSRIRLSRLLPDFREVNPVEVNPKTEETSAPIERVMWKKGWKKPRYFGSLNLFLPMIWPH